MTQDLLIPVGSVVKINDKKVLITGYFPISNGKTYVYSGCDFPIGITDFNEMYCFNKDRINSIVYEGYKSDDYNKYTKNLIESVLELNNIMKKNNNA